MSLPDRPGALYEILGLFKENDVNMTKIESHPSKIKAWDYIFFIDFIGHMHDEKVKSMMQQIKEKTSFFKVVGCYERKRSGRAH